MVREVVHDVLFLGQKSEPATQADKQVAIDLLDTLKAHEEGCVGMAANMIGGRTGRIGWTQESRRRKRGKCQTGDTFLRKASNER